MKQILIKFDESISDERAVQKVLEVIKEGKISKDNTSYSYVTTFEDGTMCCTSQHSKHPTFIIEYF